MNRFSTALLIAPALTVTLGLTGAGLGLGLARSFGLQPFGSGDPSLAGWAAALSVPGLGASVVATLWVAAASTVLSGIVGVSAAFGLRGLAVGQGRGRVSAAMVQLNLAVPHVVVAVGLLVLLSQSGLVARLAFAAGWIAEPADFPALTADPASLGVIIGSVVKEAPFIAAVVLVRLVAVGDRPAATARALGASRWQSFRYVQLPLVLPSLLAALAVVFAFTLGAYEMPAVLGASRPKLLPVLAYELYTSKDIADRPAAIALALMTALAAVTLIAGLRVLLRAPKARP